MHKNVECENKLLCSVVENKLLSSIVLQNTYVFYLILFCLKASTQKGNLNISVIIFWLQYILQFCVMLPGWFLPKNTLHS